MSATDNTNATRRGSESNGQLGVVVDAAVIDCWKANYRLDKSPHELNAFWADRAPSGAVLALRVAVAEIERLRAAAEYAAYQLEKARIWGGMEWHYNPLHPLHYLSALERLRDALRA